MLSESRKSVRAGTPGYRKLIASEVQEGGGRMSRKTKKKSPVMRAAAFAARVLLMKRIAGRAQDQAAAQTQKRRSIVPAKVKRAAVDAALIHALGGKAARVSSKKKGAGKALRKAAVTAAAPIVRPKKRSAFHRFLRMQALLLGKALLKK